MPLPSQAINKQVTPQATTSTVDSETQLKINENKEKQRELWKYLSDLSNAVSKINQDLADLGNKRSEAARAEDLQKTVAYNQVEKDKCEEAIRNLAGIFVPEIAEKYHNYYVDYYIGKKQWNSYMINSYSDISNYDNSKAESLFDSFNNSLTKANQELERISKVLSE